MREGATNTHEWLPICLNFRLHERFSLLRVVGKASRQPRDDMNTLDSTYIPLENYSENKTEVQLQLSPWFWDDEKCRRRRDSQSIQLFLHESTHYNVTSSPAATNNVFARISRSSVYDWLCRYLSLQYFIDRTTGQTNDICYVRDLRSLLLQ
jgi:hypothetical protein